MSVQIQYDYIITGAGCAGLSLLARMVDHPFFTDKKILLIDASSKNNNDRTWCFWEKDQGFFEAIIFHKWSKLHFASKAFKDDFDIFPYEYKMIKGADFYNHVLNKVQQRSNVQIVYDHVLSIKESNDKAVVNTNKTSYYGKLIFNSIIFNQPRLSKTQFYLKQHFKGWVIETKEHHFDTTTATFMDFTVSQQHGTTFAYVLPVSSNTALIEYTLFTKELLNSNQYDEGLKNYISKVLGITDYTIAEEEFGVIPMTNVQFNRNTTHVIHTGLAGNITKASSGYTFNFIQKHSDWLMQQLTTGNVINQKKNNRFDFYDATLLNILSNNTVSGEEIFTRLFKRNRIQKLLKFLDNESSLSEELLIMASLPIIPFAKAGLYQCLNR